MSRAGELDLAAIKARLADGYHDFPIDDERSAADDLAALVAEVEALREALRDLIPPSGHERTCSVTVGDEGDECDCAYKKARAALRGKP